MRLPNGFGSVYKLSGKRRKPWIAIKTIGYDENGKATKETIGYFETKKLALEKLTLYNNNPYCIETSTATYAEIYDKYSKVKFEHISRSNINSYNMSFADSSALHNMKFIDIKTHHMQDVITNLDKGHGSKRKMKTLFNQLFKFAMQNDIVHKDYARFVDIGKNTQESTRKPFTGEEIRRLFEVEQHIPFVDTILIMIYTGLRVGELITVENKNIDLENRLIVGGIKTEAGKDRVIPINDKIYDFIKERYDENNKFLLTKHNDNTKGMSYDNYYREKFIPIMNKLEMKHKPHDCRHTFATLMSKANVNEIALQKIIGHASYQTTANIYTHKNLDDLRNAIDMI